MKPPKSEPYQRPRHRAALHAWVVAATAVAAVGMPSSAVALNSRNESTVSQHDGRTPAQAARHAAGAWLDALRRGEMRAALGAMRLPALAEHERDAVDEAAALSDYLRGSGAVFEPVAERSAGHWALSAWRLDTPHDVAGGAPAGTGLIEPIMLYNPVGEDLIEAHAQWEIVPQGFADDPALAPLINADHDELAAWGRELG